MPGFLTLPNWCPTSARLWVVTSILVLVFPILAHAQRPITNFQSDIRINEDGSALVLESYEFATPAGSFDRRIVTETPDTFGNRSYLIDIAVVDDDRGKDLRYHARYASDELIIHVPSTGPRLQIVYKVRNAVRFGNQNDEFLWIANEPGSPSETAGFKVVLPDAAAGQIRVQTFLRDGGRNARTALWSYNGGVVATSSGSSVESISPGPLLPGIGAVIHVSVPSGILEQPGVFTRLEWFLRANPIVFLPICVFAIMYTIWYIKRRKSDPGMSIAPLYDPPEGLTPAEVGTLVDDTLDPRDVTATLIDLAVRGYVKLERTTPEHGALGKREDYFVRLLKPKEQWFDLKPHETTMMFHTFYGGQWTQLSSLRLRFPDIVPYMRTSVFTSLKRAGMYRVTPDNVVVQHQSILGIVYLAFWILPQIPWASIPFSISLTSTSTILSLIASVVIVFLLGRKSSPKTMRGMRAYVGIRGFEEFIKTVEADRLKRMQPGLFEKYLPYAMALGIEHRWTKAFEGIAVPTPEWIELADDLFDTVAFGHRLESVLASAALSVPRGRLPMPIAEVFGAAMGKSAD